MDFTVPGLPTVGLVLIIGTGSLGQGGNNKVYQHLCQQIDDAILGAGYSLTEKDVLLEISKTERCTANILTRQLHIDRSYMSRMISKFEKKNLIEKTLSKTDSLNILECNGVPVGSIAIANAGDAEAQLRFFMLEPEMRQRGYGNHLIEMALDFCRARGYKRVFLLTITAQVVARHIYEQHDFRRGWSRDKSEWGDGVIEERWDLEL